MNVQCRATIRCLNRPESFSLQISAQDICDVLIVLGDQGEWAHADAIAPGSRCPPEPQHNLHTTST